MRAELRARERAVRRRRNLVIAGTIGVLSLTAGTVVLWPDGDKWQDQPMASGLIPESPGDEWFDTESPSSWLRVANRQEGEPRVGSTTTVRASPSSAPRPVVRPRTWQPTVDAESTNVTGTPVPTGTHPNGDPVPPTPSNTGQPPKPSESVPTTVPTVEPTVPPDPPDDNDDCVIVILGICL